MQSSGRGIAVMFPGQGSQFVGMGREFIDSDPEAAALMDMAERVSGFPLRTLCLEGPMEELTRAVYLQPAITIIDLICWQAVHRAGITGDYFIGHSLGEYSALCAAGILSTEDTVRLVTERGRLMEREGDRNPGGMRAVLGLTAGEIDAVLRSVQGKGRVVAANYNTDKQVVISGDIAGLDAASDALHELGGKIIPLKVGVANHSPLLADAVPDFRKAMAEITFHPPRTPVLFNVSAREERDPDAIREIMAQQVASPVRWLDTIHSLLDRGVRTFIEVGPKTVLSGLVKKIVPRGTEYFCCQVDTPAGLAECLEKLG